MIYLATPYTHPKAEVRELRHRAVTAAAGAIMRWGSVVYSPITHGHTIHQAVGGLPDGWWFWRRQSLGMLERADMLAVLELDGWDESVGVREEITHARQHGIPVLRLGAEIVPQGILEDLARAVAE